MMRISKSIAVGFFSFSIAALLSILELKFFVSWWQVLRLWEGEVNPLAILGHPHMSRYLITYPGFLLEEHFPEIGFSLYIAFFFAFNVILFRKIALLAIHRPPSLVIYLGFAATHLFMNGRGVIAWTAWLICIWVCHKILMKICSPASQMGWITISCLLATVSSGMFITIMFSYIFFIFRHLNFKKQTNFIRRSLILLFGMLIGYLLFEYFLVLLEKIIEFYGGGIGAIFNMLEHGLGVILLNVNLLNISVSFFLASCALISVFLLIFNRRLSLLDRFLMMSIAGGLFGFLVLTLLIPSLLLRIQGVLWPIIGGRQQFILCSRIKGNANLDAASSSDVVLNK